MKRFLSRWAGSTLFFCGVAITMAIGGVSGWFGFGLVAGAWVLGFINMRIEHHKRMAEAHMAFALEFDEVARSLHAAVEEAVALEEAKERETP